MRLHGNSSVQYRLSGEPGTNRVKSISQTMDGTKWVGTVYGLQRLRDGSSRFEPVPRINGTVRFLRQTSDQTLWIGMIGHGLYVCRGQRFSATLALGSLPSEHF